jgi:hypothetical protein
MHTHNREKCHCAQILYQLKDAASTHATDARKRTRTNFLAYHLSIAQGYQLFFVDSMGCETIPRYGIYSDQHRLTERPVVAILLPVAVFPT